MNYIDINTKVTDSFDRKATLQAMLSMYMLHFPFPANTTAKGLVIQDVQALDIIRELAEPTSVEEGDVILINCDYWEVAGIKGSGIALKQYHNFESLKALMVKKGGLVRLSNAELALAVINWGTRGPSMYYTPTSLVITNGASYGTHKYGYYDIEVIKKGDGSDDSVRVTKFGNTVSFRFDRMFSKFVDAYKTA